MEFTYRPATEDDAPTVGETVMQGFETYRRFAPAGWNPPPELRDGTIETVRQPETWCLLGEHDGDPAGHVAWFAATRSTRWHSDEPGLAHLWQMFVREPFWGSGLAAELHARGVAAAAASGFTAMRLVTVAEQARARRFYEREGWALSEGPLDEPGLGLPVVLYRRDLRTSSS